VVKPDLVAQGEVLQAHLSELPVGDGDYGPGDRPEPGRTQANSYDRTLVFPCPAEIPHPDGLVGHDRDPAEQVFQCLLGGKSHRDTAYSKTGDHRRQINARDVKDDKGTNRHNQNLEQLLPQMKEGKSFR
jgi:hypothetical protein